MQHQQMASGRWFQMPFTHQMANVGSEVERTILWRKKNNADYSQKAFERALELLDLTISDTKNWSKLKELMRLRETLVDYFVFDDSYAFTDQSWRNYFYAFNYAARLV